jgi:hypothetical protein
MDVLSKDSFVRWRASCLWEGDNKVKISIIIELDPIRATSISLNGEESRVWKCCDGSMTLNEIIDRVIHFQQTNVSISRDYVVDFIKGLCDIGLLTLSKQKGEILHKSWGGDEIVKRNVYVDSDDEDGSVTILNNRTNLLTQLNHDWTLLWRLCDRTHTISQIVSELVTNSRDILPIDLRLRLRYLERIGAVSVSIPGGKSNAQ